MNYGNNRMRRRNIWNEEEVDEIKINNPNRVFIENRDVLGKENSAKEMF